MNKNPLEKTSAYNNNYNNKNKTYPINNPSYDIEELMIIR